VKKVWQPANDKDCLTCDDPINDAKVAALKRLYDSPETSGTENSASRQKKIDDLTTFNSYGQRSQHMQIPLSEAGRNTTKQIVF
jgi:hypothetical protein